MTTTAAPTGTTPAAALAGGTAALVGTATGTTAVGTTPGSTTAGAATAGTAAGGRGLGAEAQVVGRRYHLPRFPLPAELAARFAEVAGTDAARLGGAAHPCLVARPALGVLDALLADPALGADRSTMLHAQSDLVWHRSLLPGRDVQVDAEIVAVGPYGVRRGLVVASRVAEPDDGPAVVDVRTLLAFPPPALPVAAGRPPLAVPRREPHERAPLAELDVPIDRGFPGRYARVSGDTNPIHLDAEAARAAGLPGVVLHGLSTLALGATFVVDRLAGGDPRALARMRVRFARPGVPGHPARFAAHRARSAGRYALTCHVGGTPIWRQAVAQLRR